MPTMGDMKKFGEMQSRYDSFMNNYMDLSDDEYQKELDALWKMYEGQPQGKALEELKYTGALKRRERQLSDPASSYYKNFQDQLRKNLMDTYSTDKLISGNRARGLSMNGSGIVAQEQREAMESRVNDLASSATQQFYYNSTGQANSLLSQELQTKLQRKSEAQQQDQFNKSQTQWYEYPLSIASYAMGDWFGDGSSAGSAGQAKGR
jgi:RNAse (barnase) inhibitor barstar